VDNIFLCGSWQALDSVFDLINCSSQIWGGGGRGARALWTGLNFNFPLVNYIDHILMAPYGIAEWPPAQFVLEHAQKYTYTGRHASPRAHT